MVRGIQQGLIQAVLDANAVEATARYRVTVYPDSTEGSCQVNLFPQVS